MIEAFWQKYQYSLLLKQQSRFETELPEDGLPLPRVLFGKKTDKAYAELSDAETRLYKLNFEENKDSAVHFTFEYVDGNTKMRFARTYFLSTLSPNYMRNIYFSEDEEKRKPNERGPENEYNTKRLFQVYRALVQTYNECSDLFMRGEITSSEIKQSYAFQTFKKLLENKVDNFDKVTAGGKDSFLIDIEQLDTFGQKTGDQEKCNPQRLVMMRFQVKNILD